MSAPAVVFDRVSKKFRRGERHDSLRDLVPHALRRVIKGRDPGLSDDEFWAIRDVSLDVNAGEALGIIGPNGAGKSTTLKLLTRILKPTAGGCRVHGRVGALIEVAAGFHPDLTGRENVFLQGAIMGMKRAEVTARFDEIVEFAGVAKFIDTPVKRYSSGMNARLGFSIAAHLNPDVLIIDEVLSVGDMSFQERCVTRMQKFLYDGVAIVFVSHNLQAVAQLCRQSIYLNSTVRAAGATSDVIAGFVSEISKGDQSESATASIVAEDLVDSANQPIRSTSPAVPLALEACYRLTRPFDDVTFGFVVRRSTDNIIVYDANVHGSEVEEGWLRGGGTARLRFAFRANVTRGHYNIELHLFDNTTQAFIARLRPAATFTVEESRTYGGVADLQLNVSSVTAAVVP